LDWAKFGSVGCPAGAITPDDFFEIGTSGAFGAVAMMGGVEARDGWGDIGIGTRATVGFSAAACGILGVVALLTGVSC
jgi:hypothetical protein